MSPLKLPFSQGQIAVKILYYVDKLDSDLGDLSVVVQPVLLVPYLIQARSGKPGKIKGLADIFQEAAVQIEMHF